MQGAPFKYFAYGAAATEVEVDGFTGAHRMLRVDILHDVGDSLSPHHRPRPGRGRVRAGRRVAHARGAALGQTDGPGAGGCSPSRRAPTSCRASRRCPRSSTCDCSSTPPRTAPSTDRRRSASRRSCSRSACARRSARRSPRSARPGTASSSRSPATPEAVFWAIREARRADAARGARRDERIGCRDRAHGIATARRVRHLSRGFAVDWVDAVQRLRAARTPCVIVTLAMVRGHAPRNGGAKMVVSADALLRHRRRRQPRGDRDRPCPRDARRRRRRARAAHADAQRQGHDRVRRAVLRRRGHHAAGTRAGRAVGRDLRPRPRRARARAHPRPAADRARTSSTRAPRCSRPSGSACPARAACSPTRSRRCTCSTCRCPRPRSPTCPRARTCSS